MNNSHGEMMVLIPAWLARAAETEGRRGPRRCSADQVLTDWIWIGMDAEQHAVHAKGLRQLCDRVGLADERRIAILVSGDLAAASMASGHAIGSWAVLGMMVQSASGDVQRLVREIRGRRAWKRDVRTRLSGSLAWHARGLVGIHRMATNECYRKEIAKRLS